MRRAALALGLVAFMGILVVIGWRGEPAEETTTLAASTATTSTTAPLITTTTVGPTIPTTAAELSLVPAEEVAATGFDPVLAISAGEAWAVVSTLEDFSCVIAHHQYGFWEYWRLADAARVRDLAAAPDGTIWAAADSGVFSFDGRTWTRRFAGPAGGVAVDAQGTVWIAGSLEEDIPAPWLARGDGDQWEYLEGATLKRRAGLAPIAVGAGGKVWVGAYPGYQVGDLMRLDGTSLRPVAVGNFPDPPGAEGAVAVVTLEASPDGDLWVGGYLAADWDQVVLARFDGAAWELYDWPADHTDHPGLLFELTTSPDGVLWVGAETGLASFDGADWTWRPIDGTWVENLDVAPDGTLWYSDETGLHSRRAALG